jgi:stage IV sporulation protein FB
LKIKPNAWASIRFRIHPLFIFVWVAASLAGMFIEATTLFVIILIHELGHVWTAISYGWHVEEIQLLPFGGVAKVREYGNITAWEEIVVALAGPLNNGLMVWMAYFFSSLGWWNEEWTNFFIRANIIIGLFNLLPILPLDGGKVLQCLLSLRIPYLKAIRLSIAAGFLFSIGLIIYGVGLPFLDKLNLNAIVIGGFLIYTNGHLLATAPVQKIRFLLHRQERCLKESDFGGDVTPLLVSSRYTVEHTLRLFRRGKYHLVYIIHKNGQVIGVLSEQKLLAAYFDQHIPNQPVSDLLSR